MLTPMNKEVMPQCCYFTCIWFTKAPRLPCSANPHYSLTDSSRQLQQPRPTHQLTVTARRLLTAHTSVASKLGHGGYSDQCYKHRRYIDNIAIYRDVNSLAIYWQYIAPIFSPIFWRFFPDLIAIFADFF